MVDRDAVRRSYDEIAETYAADRSEDGRGTELLTAFLESLSASARVLDAGCGQGTPVASRLDRSASTVGLDFSREQLRLAADTVPTASLVQGDMTTFPFDPSSFDAVVAYWSLIHVPNDDQQTVVDEFARVLEPGGRLLLCDGTNEWVGENPDWLDSGVEMAWEIAGAETTRTQLRTAGFEIVGRWGVPEELDADDDGGGGGERDDRNTRKDDVDDSGVDEYPWTVFDARLASSPE